MRKKHIHLPNNLSRLDEIVEKCNEAENETDIKKANEYVEAAEAEAKSFVSQIVDASYAALLLSAAGAYILNGDIGSALSTMASFLLFAFKQIRDKWRKKNVAAPTTSQASDRDSP